MNTKRNAQWVGIAAVVAVAAIGGCADKLTMEHFDRIQQDRSSQRFVLEMIGDPSNRLDNQWIYSRPRKALTVLVDFDESGRVMRKQWIDAGGGVWEDSQEESDQADSETTRIETSHKP